MEDWNLDIDRYLETVFGISIEWFGPEKGLSLYLDASYQLCSARINDQIYKVVNLKEPMALKPATLQKHLTKLGLNPTAGDFFVTADWLPSYLRQRLVDRRIPFVVPDVQMFLPQLGYAQKELVKRSIGAKHREPVLRTSPATTSLLINILNRKVGSRMNVAELGHQLGYSAMTISRTLNEIETLEWLPIERVGKTRVLVTDVYDLRQLWTLARPLMRNPVLHKTRVMADQNAVDGVLSGEAALAEYSMLVAPEDPVFAVSKARMKQLDMDFGITDREGPETTVVEVWSYDPETTAIDGIADPVSLALVFGESSDERLLIAVDEMMEKVF